LLPFGTLHGDDELFPTDDGYSGPLIKSGACPFYGNNESTVLYVSAELCETI